MPIGQYYLRMVTARWRLLAAIVAGCTLAAWLVSTLILAQFPSYDGAARLNIVPTSQELGYADRFVRGSTFDGGGVLLQTYGEYAHTRPIVAPIVDRYIRDRAQLAHQTVDVWIAQNSTPSIFAPGPWISWLNYGATPPVPLREQLLGKLIQNTTLETVEGTYLLRLTVRWSDPESAAWFANALSDSIIEQAEDMSHVSGNDIGGSLATNLAATQAELAAKQRQSRRLKDQLGVVDIDAQKQALLAEQITELTQLTGDRADYSESEQRVAALRKRSKGKLSAAQQSVEQLLATEEPRLAGLSHGLTVRQARLGEIGNQIARLGSSEQAVKTLDTDIATLQTEVTSLQERVSFNQNENIANAPRIRLIERAVPPLVRSTPKTLFVTALGFILGCALAGCWLLLFDPAAVPPADELPAAPDDDRDEGSAERHESAPVEAPIASHAPVSVIVPNDEPGRPIRISRVAADTDANADALHTDRHEQDGDGDTQLKVRPRRAAGKGKPLSSTRAPALTMPGAHVYGGRLPLPSDGHAYRAVEVATLGASLLDWLAAPLAIAGRPLIVLGAGGDGNAKLLYELVDDLLRSNGETTHRINGTDGPLDAQPDASESRLLIYGGGLEGSVRLPLLHETDADILLAVAAWDERTGDLLTEIGETITRLTDRTPYVVVIGD